MQIKVLNDFLKNSEFEMPVCEKRYILIVFAGDLKMGKVK